MTSAPSATQNGTIPPDKDQFMKNRLTLADGSVADCFVGAECGHNCALCGGGQS